MEVRLLPINISDNPSKIQVIVYYERNPAYN